MLSMRGSSRGEEEEEVVTLDRVGEVPERSTRPKLRHGATHGKTPCTCSCNKSTESPDTGSVSGPGPVTCIQGEDLLPPPSHHYMTCVFMIPTNTASSSTESFWVKSVSKMPEMKNESDSYRSQRTAARDVQVPSVLQDAGCVCSKCQK